LEKGNVNTKNRINKLRKGVEIMVGQIMSEETKFSRRSVLAGAGKLLAGTAGLAMVSTAGQGLLSKINAKEAPKWPWGYKKIDPARAAQIAYDKYYEGACCYGVVCGILIPLQDEIGEPYASLPLDAFRFGHSGVVGWGTTCGTLIGAGIATGFIAGETGEEILNKVIGWYCVTSLPNYNPVSPKSNIKNTSKSDSPLCHISAGRWMKKEGVAFDSAPRKERCARLAANVATKAVSFLNEWAEGKMGVVPESQIKLCSIPAQNNCTDCHGRNVPSIKN
jgi:hypothetical protein